MRYSPEHKAHTRIKILEAAGRRFRKYGFGETSVAKIMRDARLTHGGFYAHFRSKNELVGEVIRSGFNCVSDRFESRFDHLEGNAWLRAWVEGYLSQTHQQATGEGCPMPAVAAEIARAGPEARSGFTDLCRERMKKVAERVSAPRPEAERRVLAALCQMAGALMMARAVEEPLATRVREAAAEEAIRTLTIEAPREAGQQ